MSVEVEVDERTQNVMLFVLGTLHDLKADGYIKGGCVDLTDGGHNAYQELKATGFEPSEEETLEMMAYLQEEAGSVLRAEKT